MTWPASARKRLHVVGLLLAGLLITLLQPVLGPAQTVERWHLFLPPLVYNKADNRFEKVADLPLASWYHKGEFATYGHCHTERSTKLLEAVAAAREPKNDPEGYAKWEVWAYERARCVSSKDLR